MIDIGFFSGLLLATCGGLVYEIIRLRSALADEQIETLKASERARRSEARDCDLEEFKREVRTISARLTIAEDKPEIIDVPETPKTTDLTFPEKPKIIRLSRDTPDELRRLDRNALFVLNESLLSLKRRARLSAEQIELHDWVNFFLCIRSFGVALD